MPSERVVTSEPAPVRGAGRPRRRWLLRAGFSAVYLAVAGEIFLRILAPVPMLPRYVDAKPYGVRGNQPGARFWHRTPDYEIEFRINSRGVRDDEEIPYAKPPGEKRILLLGDSFAIGYGATLDQTFLSQAASALARVGHPVRVVNMGVSGHGTAEELITLREEGRLYQPDVVVVAWHPTDVEDNLRSKLFALGSDGDVVQINDVYLPAVRVRTFLFSLPGYRWLAGSSHLYNFVRGEVSGWAKDLLLALRGLGREKTGRETPVAPGPSPTGPSAPEQLTIALLHAIEREAAAIGADLVVVDIPAWRPGPVYTSEFPRDPEGADFGLRVVSPVQAFYDQGDELLVWQRSHFHFTPPGNRIVGALLARRILEDRLLDE